MNEQIFLKEYADTRLSDWWEKSERRLRGEMLELIAKLNQTPLAQLDQFTVGEHTDQSDGWLGARLVFAIKNRVRATKKSFCLSLALNPEMITASICHELNPIGRSGGGRWSASVEELLEWLEGLEEQQLRTLVDQKLEMRRVNGRPKQRSARRPRDYG